MDIPWQYNVTVPGGGIDAVTVTTRMATISGVPYTADLEVQLTTGGSFMLPVQGVYEGVAYSPIVSAHLSNCVCEHVVGLRDVFGQGVSLW